MKKLYLVLFIQLFLWQVVVAQIRLDLFTKKSNQNLAAYLNIAFLPDNDKLKNVVMLEKVLSFNQVASLNATKFLISLPISATNDVVLDITEKKILTDDFVITTSSGETYKPQNIKFYQGKVVGKNSSSVAITINENGIEGGINIDGEQYTIAKLRGDVNNTHIVYNVADMTEEQPFTCGELIRPSSPSKRVAITANTTTSTVCKNVRIYIETDYKFYQSFGNNQTTLTNHVTALFNQVAILYANENVAIQLSELKVWTTADPETSLTDIGEVLTSFKNRWNAQNNTFNGDIAHLISGRNLGGGLAYLETLNGVNPTNINQYKAVFYDGGKDYAFGVSSSHSTTLVNIPTFSWNVEVMSHEIGHNFGLPHTHNCVWNVNGTGTGIDNCGATAGYPEGTCDSPTPPAGGGTIMSYCHLVPSAGISFSNGFGTLPGDKMRAEVATAPSLQTSTITAPTATSESSCGIGVLSASGCLGTYHWYKASTSGTSLAATDTYSPTVSSTTTYYVDCSIGNCTSTRTPATIVGIVITNFLQKGIVNNTFINNSITQNASLLINLNNENTIAANTIEFAIADNDFYIISNTSSNTYLYPTTITAGQTNISIPIAFDGLAKSSSLKTITVTATLHSP